MKLYLSPRRALIYILWLAVLLALCFRFRAAFLIVALIIALAGGLADMLLLLFMAAKTEISIETEESGIFIHIKVKSPVPAAPLVVTLVSSSDRGRQLVAETSYPIYSSADYREMVPPELEQQGGYTVSVEKAVQSSLLGIFGARLAVG